MGQVSPDVVSDAAEIKQEVTPSVQSDEILHSFYSFEIIESLEHLGYDVRSSSTNVFSIVDAIQGSEYSIVFSFSPEMRNFSMTCKVGDLNNIGSNVENQRDFLFACVNMNDRITPFATSILTNEDDSSVAEDSFPVVLISTFPLYTMYDVRAVLHKLDEKEERKNVISSYLTLLRKAVIFMKSQTSISNFQL